jgi:hypothetical protein
MGYEIHNVVPEEGINDFPGDERRVLGWIADMNWWETVSYDPAPMEDNFFHTGWTTDAGIVVPVYYWTDLPELNLDMKRVAGCYNPNRKV